MLASISIILNNPVLIGGLLLCVLIGGISFLAAILLCRIKGVGVTTLKYVLTIISIEAITNFFMIVLCPSEFLENRQLLNSLNIVVGFILFWVLIYEAKGVMKHPRMQKLKKDLKIKCLSPKNN